MLRLIAAALVLAASSVSAFAFEGENLLVSMPQGYKIGFQKRQGNAQISEMVPSAETVESWTEMLTVQVFHGLATAPEQFRDRVAQAWAKACARAIVKPIASAVEKGYPVAFWLLSCPLNAQSGKPEVTFMKAIRGKDSFYVVQKAFRFEPSQAQVVTWTQFLKNVGVCDTRLAERACPNGIR